MQNKETTNNAKLIGIHPLVNFIKHTRTEPHDAFSYHKYKTTMIILKTYENGVQATDEIVTWGDKQKDNEHELFQRCIRTLSKTCKELHDNL